VPLPCPRCARVPALSGRAPPRPALSDHRARRLQHAARIMRTRTLAFAITSLLAAACGEVKAPDSEPSEDTGAIDDLEDGDALIPTDEGRIGYWYTAHDSTAGHMGPWPFAPTFGGASDSQYAAAAYGGAFTEWGSKLGVYLQFPQNGILGAYDASEFTGIHFDARSNVPLRVAFATLDTLDAAVGGTCVVSETVNCNDFHGTNVTLTAEWTSYDIPFDVLAQAGWGVPAPFDPSNAVSIEFQIDKNLDFDFAIDNVSLY
jgi:hypothetical protein